MVVTGVWIQKTPWNRGVWKELSKGEKWVWEMKRLLLCRRKAPFQNTITTAHPLKVCKCEKWTFKNCPTLCGIVWNSKLKYFSYSYWQIDFIVVKLAWPCKTRQVYFRLSMQPTTTHWPANHRQKGKQWTQKQPQPKQTKTTAFQSCYAPMKTQQDTATKTQKRKKHTQPHWPTLQPLVHFQYWKSCVMLVEQ